MFSIGEWVMFLFCSNGDQYEGGWVRGMKQGHGTMKYNDGTIYDVSFPG